jgi:hypothetical protein
LGILKGLDYLGTLGIDGLMVIWKWILEKYGVKERTQFW